MCYAIGTTLTIAGSFFLWGPVSQAKKAFDKDRRVASIVLILSIVLVLTFAFLGVTAVVFFMLLIQFGAFWWYSIVMLPFGRQIACACMKNCCKEGK